MNTDLNHSHPPHVHDQLHQDHRHLNSGPPGPEAAVAGAQWTCPMHPEVVRDSAGDCPICGMALVAMAGTGMGAGANANAGVDQGEPDDSELRDLARRLRVGIVLAIPLVVVAMSPMAGIHEPF